MRIILAGGSGFLGRPLGQALAGAGHDVLVLSRSAQSAPDAAWPGEPGVRQAAWPGTAVLDGWAHLVDGADAVINLAGESIAGVRWTAARKTALERSRIDSTRALVAAIGQATRPPALLINGSAVGIYGSRGDETLPESAPPGHDFLARLAVAWEREAARASSEHTRVICVRTGIVLATDGGALERMLLPFRLGVGGPMGSGRQYMAWIHREDWLAMMQWLLSRPAAQGIYNAAAPNPVTNAEFTRALGAALRRPAVLPAPAFALRLALGEMADPLLLASQRVVPARALEQGFTFRHPTLGPALADVLRTT
jgi:uncharacterized protein (TIGR01777 family)